MNLLMSLKLHNSWKIQRMTKIDMIRKKIVTSNNLPMVKMPAAQQGQGSIMRDPVMPLIQSESAG